MASLFSFDPTFDQTIIGDSSPNTLIGGSGNDQISGLGRQDHLFGRSGSDLLLGGVSNDWLYGQVGVDKLEGNQGSDRLFGGQDDDWLLGGGGEDWLWGQGGNDDLEGGRGHDRLWGGAGDDLLIGGLGRDSLFGGTGDDIFAIAPKMGLDTIFDFQSGLDRIRLEAGTALEDLRFTTQRGDPQDTFIIWKPDGATRGRRIATVKGITPEQLSEADFIVPDDGNAPPMANADELSVDEGGTTTQTTTGSNSLLTNDTDPDLPNETLIVNLALVDDPSFGTVTLEEDGTFRYIHDGSENFSDRFIYEIQDEAGATSQAAVEITINPVNDAPVLEAIADQSFTLGSELRVPLTATDPDSPPEALTFSLVEPPEGMAIDPESQAIVWTPMLGDLVGDFEVTVQVSDNGDPALSDETTFLVSVLPPAALEVTAGLANDTGASESDGMTSDPMIAGTISDVLNLDLLEVAIAGPVSGSFSVTAPGTDFSLSREEIEAQLGESLTDGEYTVEVSATDIFGNRSTPAEFTFFLDSQAPGAPTGLMLTSGSDMGSSNSDGITSNNTPVITGDAELGSVIQILDGDEAIIGQTTVSSPFEITLDLLTEGTQSLRAIATDTAGNVSLPSNSIEVTIDTEQPMLDLTSPLANDELTDASRLQGTAIDLGSGLASLSYRFDEVDLMTVLVDANGNFDEGFDLSNLAVGSYTLSLTAIDLAGNAITSSLSVTIADDGIPDVDAPVIAAALVNDTGTSDADEITMDPAIAGSVSDESAISSFRAGLGNTPVSEFVDVSTQLQPDGSFAFDAVTLAEINGGTALADGEQVLNLVATDAVGNASEVFAIDFTVDNLGPIPFAGRVSESESTLEVAFDEAVNAAAFVAGNYRLEIVSGNDAGSAIAITATEQVNDRVVRLSFETPLTSEASYRLELEPVIQDLAGNAIAANTSLDISVNPPTIELAPIDGEARVALNRKTVVRFGQKVDPTTVTEETVYLIANGERLPGRLEVSSTHEFATFIPTEPLPASTEVRVVVQGDDIKTLNGVAFDADLDGVAGGTGTADFTTVPLTQIPGTNIFGYVFDSYNRNPDGSDRPIEGATIRVDGLPDVFAVTDETGYFKLEDLPAPDVFVFIDGSTAVGAPEGTQYASLGKPFHSLPGQEIQLAMDGETFDIFLPLMEMGDVQALSATSETEVGFGDGALALLQETLPEIDPSIWEAVQVTFPSGSARDNEGNPATQALIVPVDPSRLPAPLPPNLDPGLVISVQAGGENGFNREASGGATYFDVPAPVVFPNFDGLAPGEKATLFSFDHEAGHWVPIGLGTVSNNGLMIESDPGVGILAPGWHFVSPPLNWGGDGGRPIGNEPIDIELINDVEVDLLGVESNNTINLTFLPPPGVGRKIGEHELPQGSGNAVRTVEIVVNGPLNKYYDIQPLRNNFQEITTDGISIFRTTLQQGDDALELVLTQLGLETIRSNENGNNIDKGIPFDRDVLYGSEIKIIDTLTLPDGSRLKSTKVKIPYLYIDESDQNPNNQLDFASVITPGNINRTRNYDLFLGGAPQPVLVFEERNINDFISTNNEIIFNPQEAGVRSSNLKARIYFEGSEYISNNSLVVAGRGLLKNKINFNKAELKFILQKISSSRTELDDVDSILLTKNEIKNFDELDEINNIAQSTYRRFKSLFAPFEEAIDFSDSLSSTSMEDTVTVKWLTSAVPGAFGSSGTSSSPDSGDDGTDDLRRIVSAIQKKSDFGKAAQAFRLAQAMNTDRESNVYVYVDNHLEDGPYEISHIELINALAKTAAHEVAHTLGLIHTAQVIRTDTVSEVQQLLLGLGDISSRFKLNFNGEETPEFSKNVSEITLQRALEELPNIGQDNILVAKVEDGVYELTFVGKLVGLDLPKVEAIITSDLSGTFTVNENTLEDGFLVPIFSASEIKLPQISGREDILSGGLNDYGGTQLFQNGLSGDALLLGLKLGWTQENADNTISYFTRIISQSDKSQIGEDIINPELAINGPLLRIFGRNNKLVSGTIDFPATNINNNRFDEISLVNVGSEEIIVNNVEVLGDSGAFDLNGLAMGKVIAPGETVIVDLKFRPLTSGKVFASILINSNDQESPQLSLNLNGFGIASDPEFSLKLLAQNNNLGGVPISVSTSFEKFITITNTGATDLTFTPTLLNGQADFSLGAFEDVEQTLTLNETLTIPVIFTPSTTGLRLGQIQFTTNDPNQLTFSQGIVGTGIPEGTLDFDWGNDFVAIEYNDFLQRTISNDAGHFMFELPTFNRYDIGIFDPDSGLIAQSGGFTGPAGALTDLTTGLTFRPSEAPDTDGDGLPDDIEFAIGTDLKNTDTDGDGLSDFAEIENRLNATSGQSFPTGIIASLPLRGEAKAVVVEGSVSEDRDQLAYVATGIYGLAIVDASEFDNPIILGQLDLPGDAVDVAVDSNLQIAALATSSGLHLVNVSDPMQPSLIQTANLIATQVEVLDGVAYATVGNTLNTVDLFTGEVIQGLTLPGSGIVTGLARESSILYAYISGSDTFVTLDITDPSAVQTLGQLNVDIASIDVGVTVGNGIAYLAGSGLSTIDVSDPLAPRLISPADFFFTSRNVAVNGSGLALIAAEDQGIGVYDISNPQNTSDLLLSVDTPTFAQDVTIASGIAYVADSQGGLQIINYLPFDSQGTPPNVSITTDVEDLDPAQDGIQVFEGTSIPVQVDITDDVQVRNVELIVNGQVVQNDVSFPFDATAIAQANQFLNNTSTIQVRATDTGGNRTLSNLITLDLVPDTFNPELLNIDPSEGSQLESGFIQRVNLDFSEALNPETINANSVQLFNNQDELIQPINIQLRNDDQSVQLIYNTLPVGEYRLVIQGLQITDRAGNNLSDDTIESQFFITPSRQFNLSDLNGTNGFVLNGIDAFDELGFSVSSAGDFNGDGVDDIILGARFAETIENRPHQDGEAYVVFGKTGVFPTELNLAELDGFNGFRLVSSDRDAQFGFSVSAAGDVNGDDIGDIIIGSPFADPNGNIDAGKTYLLFGQKGWSQEQFNIDALNGLNGFVINGSDGSTEGIFDFGDRLGTSVGGAGDINGDGFDDIIIGAIGADPNDKRNAGTSFIIFGKGDGFDEQVDLSDLDGSNGFLINGFDTSHFFGGSVSSAGDVNGDGIDDIIIGATGVDGIGQLGFNTSDLGESYVIFGDTGDFPENFNLASLNGNNGFRIIGIDGTDVSGAAVSNAGDFNGDGFDDIIIGAPGTDRNGRDAGESYVIFGKAGGFDAELKLANLDGSDGILINGIFAEFNSPNSSGGSVSAAGDVNQDGFDDIIIGAAGADQNEIQAVLGTGQAYILYGKAGNFDAQFDLVNLNGLNGFALNGENDGDYLGISVSAAGDINGDGFDDVIIGAHFAFTDDARTGKSYVVFGG